jgi:hypothetical protein
MAFGRGATYSGVGAGGQLRVCFRRPTELWLLQGGTRSGCGFAGDCDAEAELPARVTCSAHPPRRAKCMLPFASASEAVKRDAGSTFFPTTVFLLPRRLAGGGVVNQADGSSLYYSCSLLFHLQCSPCARCEIIIHFLLSLFFLNTCHQLINFFRNTVQIYIRTIIHPYKHTYTHPTSISTSERLDWFDRDSQSRSPRAARCRRGRRLSLKE